MANLTAVCNWILDAPEKSIENFYFWDFFLLFAQPDLCYFALLEDFSLKKMVKSVKVFPFSF